MLTLFAVLAAAALTGDFDHDGTQDLAFVRTSGGVHEIVVVLRGRETVVDTVRGQQPPVLTKLAPGSHATACAKGLGADSAPCPVRAITARGDTLQFGTPESAQAAAVWTGEGFRVVWLSD